jgi:hypothetical protein
MMILWLFPVWAVPTTALVIVLMGVLMLLVRTRRHLKQQVGTLTPYTDRHGAALTERIERVAAMTAEHRASLVRDREHFDELSEETRAVIAALEAEEEGNGAKSARHRR